MNFFIIFLLASPLIVFFILSDIIITIKVFGKPLKSTPNNINNVYDFLSEEASIIDCTNIIVNHTYDEIDVISRTNSFLYPYYIKIKTSNDVYEYRTIRRGTIIYRLIKDKYLFLN